MTRKDLREEAVKKTGELADCACVSASGSVSDSVCFSTCVFDLTASLDPETEILSISSLTSHSSCVSQTFSCGKQE